MALIATVPPGLLLDLSPRYEPPLRLGRSHGPPDTLVAVQISGSEDNGL